MFRKLHVGSNHRVRVAFRDEYVRADGFCRIGGGERQQFRTDEGEPSAQPQSPQKWNRYEKFQ
jgi:hypothetical protein